VQKTLIKLHRKKLSHIVSHYIVGDIEPVHDLRDEFHRLGSHYGSHRLRFDTLSELVHYYEDMCESSFSFFKRTYQI
jgi:hypothetical protein